MEKVQAEATFEVWTFPWDFSPQQETSREARVSMHGDYFLSLHFILWGRGQNCRPNKMVNLTQLCIYSLPGPQIPAPSSLDASFLPP